MNQKHMSGRDEPIIDPELPIIDAHHHLFVRKNLEYMLDEYISDTEAGHNIIASVYVETQFMARPGGPKVLQPLGEVEFANGIAAMAETRRFGRCQVAAAIVGHADLSLGAAVSELLDRSLQTAPDRFRGIRQNLMTHPDPSVFSSFETPPVQGVLDRPHFREGFKQLAPRKLSFDAAVLHHQLPEIGHLAAENDDTVIILNHLGMALNRSKSLSDRAEIFQDWRSKIIDLARRPNVYCKIGGLGTVYWGFGFDLRVDAPGYRELADAWSPYIETAIEAFGVNRCMMESNYPPDGRSGGFVPIWNALKYVVRDCSEEEKRALFHRTAEAAYRIRLE